MGGLPSCKCNKESDNAEIRLKTEGDKDLNLVEQEVKDKNLIENTMTKTNKKFNLSALNISDSDLLRIDQKALIKNFFGRGENSFNLSPVRNNTIDKSISSISEDDKVNNSQSQTIKAYEKIPANKKKTPPLEIINEVNTEDNLQDQFNKNSDNKTTSDTKLEYSNYSLIDIKNKSAFIINRNENYHNHFKRNHHEIIVEKHYGEENYTLESKKLSAIDTNTINKIDEFNFFSINKSAPKLHSKGTNIQDTWKSVDISNIVNEKKINSLNDNDLIYQSEVYKYTIPTKYNSHPYISKFLLITKSELIYYKSKESFLRCQNPLFHVGINRLLQCNRVHIQNSETSKKYKLQMNLHHFYLNLVHSCSDSKQLNLSPNNASNESVHRIKGNSTRFILGNNEMVKKMTLIPCKSNESAENHNTSKISTNTNNVNIGSQLTLIFASNNEELVNKWVGILNYMMKQ